MSSPAHAHDAHGHGGGDHVPHVLPLVDYFKTYGALLVLTVITVAASYVHLGHTLNLIVAMLIATIKASVVAAIFMHLFWDQKFFAVVFSSTILFLAIFLAFTMFDTEARGVADPLEGLKPANWKQPFSGTSEDDHIKRSVEAEKKAAAEGRAAHRAGPAGGQGGSARPRRRPAQAAPAVSGGGAPARRIPSSPTRDSLLALTCSCSDGWPRSRWARGRRAPGRPAISAPSLAEATRPHGILLESTAPRPTASRRRLAGEARGRARRRGRRLATVGVAPTGGHP
jgi:cytochrome c oxidase subunit 4